MLKIKFFLTKKENLILFTKEFKIKFPEAIIGYSSHDIGTFIPCVAVSLGAKVIEKHFTLNKTYIGTDHQTALTPEELKEMVNNIRYTEQSLGSIKKIQNSEKLCIQKLCKSITSTVSIKKGDIITENMITTKSPGTGILASSYYSIIGQAAINDIKADTTITYNDIMIL